MGEWGREKVDSASERNRIESRHTTRALTESRAFISLRMESFTNTKRRFSPYFLISYGAPRWLDFFYCLLYSLFFLFGECQQKYNTLRYIFDTKLNWVYATLRAITSTTRYTSAVLWLISKTFSVDCRLTISYSRAVSHHFIPAYFLSS